MSQATLADRSYTNSNLFSGHYLDERITQRDEWDCDDEAREALEELRALFQDERELMAGYGEDSLIDNWIGAVLEILGFGTHVETTLPDGSGYVDTLLFENTDARREAATVYLDTENTADLFDGGFGILEAKQWDADFSQRFSEQRPYRNASHQIKHYLERTPENVQWGILTNGRKWRLYGTKDYETQTYYEIDLPELLERGDLEAFKYFYVFFRPEAFRERGGPTFLDSVWSESETVAQQLGEDLQDNVFTALRVLGRGFAETNDIDIAPDDDAALGELKDQSLVLLYRLMFVLYAESRGLIHPEGGEAVEEYEENFSLDELRLEIHEEIGEIDEGFDNAYSEYSTTMWSRLEDLFRLIDEGEEKLGIPPYNGGLFNQEKHEFLTNHEVSNRYLAEVIYRISTTENDEGRYVLADYADLDTRHLGSVYEGLLEHQFRIAPEAYAAVSADGGQVWRPATEVSVAEAVETVDDGGLYVVNDEGERKATGAYYTPDYVVTYIVEETVGPLVEEIKTDLVQQGFEPGTHEYLGEFYRRVTDLKLLDPAMGSGHFLTRATEYLAQQVMEEVRELDEATAFDEQRVRRDVAKECIYGVDLNGMAVELAKLSMWLETLAADQPLAFLDHHLKAGNSLVGSDVTEVLSSDSASENGQLTLEQALDRMRQDTLEHVMERMRELLEIDNESLEDVKSMEEIYDEVRSDPFYQRLFELTNVHTAEQFDLKVPERAYERMAEVIDDEDAWAEIREEDWFQTAQAMCDEEAFFHWELEYPEVFFDDEGEKREDAGFDAVIGNPPYINANERNKSGLEHHKKYWKTEFCSAYGAYDIYILFFEKGLKLLPEGNRLGFITPNKYLSSPYGQALREYIVSNHTLSKINDVSQMSVFSDVSVYPIVTLISSGEQEKEITIQDGHGYVIDEKGRYDQAVLYDLPDLIWGFLLSEGLPIIERIEETSKPLGDVTEVVASTTAAEADEFSEAIHQRNSPGASEKKLVNTGSIDPYIDLWGVEALTHQGDSYQNPVLDTTHPAVEQRRIDQYDSEKLLFAKLAMEIEAMIDRSGEFASVNTNFVMDSGVKLKYLAAVCNSTIATWIYEQYFGALRMSGGYLQFQAPQLKAIPIPEHDAGHIESEFEENEADIRELCEDLVRSPQSQTMDLRSVNVSHLETLLVPLVENIHRYLDEKKWVDPQLRSYLGGYSTGDTLSDIGFSQPIAGAESIVQGTSDEYENLRVGTVEVIRSSPTVLEIRLTARYKPEDNDEYETDRWGYTETEPLPALRISDLSETEADLLEAFVPVAVDEAGGFANFRETATKTNSLVDRLRALTLPAVDDVRDGLESYLETKARAEELEAKIERTDALIDEIVYELYGLSDEEIEIVEEAVEE